MTDSAVHLPPHLSPDTTRALARRRLADAFRDGGISSADLDARLLVAAAAGTDHAGLIRDPDMPIGAAAAALMAFATRRLRHEPVSRILGRRAFWGLSLEINPAVLDPRPETEGLVASVIDAVGGRRDQTLKLLDLGTGSGAILGALLREFPSAQGVGVDRSLDACHVAAHNLEALGVGARASIVCGDWGQALRGAFDVVVSNPPYIATGDLDGLDRDVRDYDPRAALDGGADGFDAYRTLVPGVEALLGPGGIAAFECGAGQGATIAALMSEAGLVGSVVYLDLAGHDRVVMGLKKSGPQTIFNLANDVVPSRQPTPIDRGI